MNMKTYEIYQEVRDKRYLAQNWISNKDKIDSQSHSKYSLSNLSFSADYCGQQYAGANNYHASPKDFNDAVCKVIKMRCDEIFNQALEILKEEERVALIACKEDLLKASAEIEKAESLSATNSVGQL